jgi:hypothetical protein
MAAVKAELAIKDHANVALKEKARWMAVVQLRSRSRP